MFHPTVDALTKLAKQLCPPGMVQAYAGAIAPEGFLNCAGQEVSRIDYPELFSAIGTMYGAGDGSTTFNLPDYRGYFLRGHDGGKGADPDVLSREPRADGTGGDNVGTLQTDQVQDHKHEHIDRYWQLYEGNTVKEFVQYDSSSYINKTRTTTDPVTGNHGLETRPKNITVLYVIKT